SALEVRIRGPGQDRDGPGQADLVHPGKHQRGDVQVVLHVDSPIRWDGPPGSPAVSVAPCGHEPADRQRGTDKLPTRVHRTPPRPGRIPAPDRRTSLPAGGAPLPPAPAPRTAPGGSPPHGGIPRRRSAGPRGPP